MFSFFHVPSRESWGSLLVGGYLGLVVSVVLASPPAFAYDEFDYCVDMGIADRMDCRSIYYADRALCLGDRAFDRWLEDPRTDALFVECITTAQTTRDECYIDIVDCGVDPTP